MTNSTLNASRALDQEWTEQLVLAPEMSAGGSSFGVATAISRDGKVLAVGSPLATTGDANDGIGVVYLYRMDNNGQWEFSTYFPSGSDTDIQFGAALSLNADGTVLAIGAPGAEDDKGSVYVSHRSDDWNTPEPLIVDQPVGGLPVGASFGYAVSLSGDGHRLAVSRGGVTGNTTEDKKHGVYLYKHEQDWIIEATFKNYDSQIRSLVLSVCLSADGTKLAMGIPDLRTGRAYVAVDVDGHVHWEEETEPLHIAPQAGIGDAPNFGASVSLNADGSVLAVGTRAAMVGTVSRAGNVHVLKSGADASGYVFDRILSATHTLEDGAFGASVSLSDDGLWMAVGAPSPNQLSAADSRAYLFHKEGEGDDWIEKKKIFHDGDDSGNYLGTSVSLSSDGTICAVGAPTTGDSYGDGMVFVLSPLVDTGPEPGSGIFSKVPGVYVEEVNSLLLTIPTGATAIPVFIGRFRTPEDDPVPNDACLPVKSWLDFTRTYGDSAPVTVTSIVLRQGRKGGGTVQETIRVDHIPHLGSLSLRHYFENGGGPCYILSLHERGDATEVAAMAEKIARCPDVSLICLCDVTEPETDQALYDALSGLLNRDLGYFLLADVDAGDPPNPEAITRPATPAQHTALYYPGLETSYSPRPADTSIFVGIGEERLTLADLDTTTEPTYAAVSDAVDNYFSQVGKATVYLRATPAVAGAYCKTDRERGVWKAPANVALAGVRKLCVHNGNPMVQFEAKTGVNQIRYFSDRGAVIMGARTMVPPETPTWLYVPVRRLFNAAERDIKAAMRFAIFEPNSPPTWEAVRAAIGNYLYRLWRDGGLAGATEEEAYFVQIGLGVTMTPANIADGCMIVKIGMAAVRPAEFILLEFTQDVQPG